MVEKHKIGEDSLSIFNKSFHTPNEKRWPEQLKEFHLANENDYFSSTLTAKIIGITFNYLNYIRRNNTGPQFKLYGTLTRPRIFYQKKTILKWMELNPLDSIPNHGRLFLEKGVKRKYDRL